MAEAPLPPQLIPLTFKLATASDASVKRGIFGLYAGLVILSLVISTFVIGTALTLSGVLKVVGIVGDGMALGVLVVSSMVQRASQDGYVAAYTKVARKVYPNYSDAQLKQALEDLFGKMKDRTGNVMKLDVGSILLAVSTILAFVGGLLKT